MRLDTGCILEEDLEEFGRPDLEAFGREFVQVSKDLTETPKRHVEKLGDRPCKGFHLGLQGTGAGKSSVIRTLLLGLSNVLLWILFGRR